MKFDQKISAKSEMRMHRLMIILSISLIAASCFSYITLEAFGQESIASFDCPENAYYGFDNSGNRVCRDVLSNQILEPIYSEIISEIVSENIIISDTSEGISDTSEEISDSVIVPEITGEPAPVAQIVIISIIIAVGSIIGVLAKKWKFTIPQRGWSSIQKEQVRERQYGNCNMCYTTTSKWKYDYFDGNKNNHDISNCQGLCPDCYSKRNQVII